LVVEGRLWKREREASFAFDAHTRPEIFLFHSLFLVLANNSSAELASL